MDSKRLMSVRKIVHKSLILDNFDQLLVENDLFVDLLLLNALTLMLSKCSVVDEQVHHFLTQVLVLYV